MSLKDALEKLRETNKDIKDQLVANSGVSWSCTSNCVKTAAIEA